MAHRILDICNKYMHEVYVENSILEKRKITSQTLFHFEAKGIHMHHTTLLHRRKTMPPVVV